MSKLKIEDIRKEVAKHKWKLCSEKYINLKTEMEFECPNGHTVVKNYGSLRRAFYCPICSKNPLNENESIPTPKKKGFRILAFDQATQISGYALFEDKELLKYGKYTAPDLTTVERIVKIREWGLNLIHNFKPDLILLEDIQLQNFSGKKGAYLKGNGNQQGITTFKVLAELLGVMKNLAAENKIAFEVVSASTWRSGIGVTGRTRADQKRSAQFKIESWYHTKVTQDEADAICLGRYGTKNFYKPVEMIRWG